MSAAATDLSSLHIALVGCGKMGGAMLRGWLDAGIGKVDVLDPAPPSALLQDERVNTHSDAATLSGPWDMVVLAVKPQIMKDVCISIAPHITPDQAILSIAAGQTIAVLQGYFDDAQPVIRAMPNTPAAIGAGTTVACPSAQISDEMRSMADMLLGSTGTVLWTDNEDHMDAVTAVSGSGPAYLFYLIEALTKAAAKTGLPDDFAATLVRQTVIGSAALAAKDANIPAATLRENVTSPGGTTEAALKILMDGRLQDIMIDAVEAAQKRSRELSS